MKNFFTSVMAALFMAAPVGNLSAQTSQQLTKSQEEAIKKELLPVVFEQIKEQAGIDILGWATPKLNANTLSGIPVLESSNLLRAGTAQEDISVKPDSIILFMDKLGKVKLEFENYSDKKFPSVVGDRALALSLPEDIIVRLGMAEVAKLSFKSEGEILPFKLQANLSLLQQPAKNLFTFSLELKKQMLDAVLKLGEGLTELVPGLPDLDYNVKINISDINSQLPMSLYGVKGTTIIPMGDATLLLDFDNKQMPLKSIDVTSYEKGTADEWDRLAFSLAENKQNIILSIDEFEFTQGFTGEGKYNKSTVITMTDNTKNIGTDTKSVINSLVSRVVNELANEGQATPYKMVIEQGDKNVTAGLEKKLEAEVVTYFPSLKSAIAEIRINTYEDGTAIPMLIKATADLTGSKKIAVDVIQGETSFATAYFTSNIAGVITSNESVQVSDVKVIPTANAIRVLNADKASYQIYSITGAMMANGTIAGDAYISTANLAKGIYIVVVEANGVKQSVKFIR